MLTYLDTNVLVQAATGKDPALKARAQAIIFDRRRKFVSSYFSKLETVPLAIHFGRLNERKFYELFYGSMVAHWVDPQDIYDEAYRLACQYALGGMDALHVAAAQHFGAELISAEKPTKPLFKAYPKAMSIY
jgi:predicted nucleic acid-binding protein